MRVRYWYTWKGHRKEYDDVEEDDSITPEELEQLAQDNAAERCEYNGWYQILDEKDEGND